MAVINYKKELVEFDFKDSYYLNTDGAAVASIKFFIHVWQRAECLQDVLDTVNHAYAASDYTQQIKDRFKIANHSVWRTRSTIRSRAARWRKKGIPLKRLSSVATLESLKRFALQEAM